MSKGQNKIKDIEQQLAELGPLLPGSISEQWNVCGKAGCRCKSKDNPQKHGPYQKLSFTILGKSSTMFIKKDDLGEANKRIVAYGKFKKLSGELVLAWVNEAKEEGLHER
jgi:hypothetical protein